MEWSNEVWGRAKEPWPEEQTEPTRQQRRDLAPLDAMESVWREARQEDEQREWVRQCEVTGDCTVCGSGPAEACRERGSCSEAMRQLR